MKTLTISTSVTQLSPSELTPEQKDLADHAIRATYRSYSPYSHFSVGAAIQLSDSTIVSGSNQENIAYPSGLCAERTALFYANSRYPDLPVTRLCIAARNDKEALTETPVPPCGSCRQALLETELRYKTPIEVILVGANTAYIIQSIRDLLPLCFDSFCPPIALPVTQK